MVGFSYKYSVSSQTLHITVIFCIIFYRDDFCDYFDFINRCERFFIEIISCLCFEHTYDSKNPSQDLIDYLMSCVYAESGSTQRLSPFLDEEQRDAAPVIRSYLLKLLIGVK